MLHTYKYLTPSNKKLHTIRINTQYTRVILVVFLSLKLFSTHNNLDLQVFSGKGKGHTT